MKPSEEIRQQLFRIGNEQDFNELALKIFQFQYTENPVYQQLARLLDRVPGKIDHFLRVPFIPSTFFRDKKILCGDENTVQKIFTSSGTTGNVPSRHFIRDIGLYEESFTRAFRIYYGDPGGYRLLALLPGYLEREGSSLVYMVNHFIKGSLKNGSGFFLHNMDELGKILLDEAHRPRTILFGASYALLDFAEKTEMDLRGVTIMETGGMKGRRREIIREELHEVLRIRLNADRIHSEYGMTELLSQAYSQGSGIFRCPPWMKVLIRDPHDPLDILPPGETGGINIIDLANLYSCSFIATQDLGKLHEDGSFEVLGRFDDSDVRGCNLMVV